jgi:tetratricopeptide (TPR) repeat protein
MNYISDRSQDLWLKAIRCGILVLFFQTTVTFASEENLNPKTSAKKATTTRSKIAPDQAAANRRKNADMLIKKYGPRGAELSIDELGKLAEAYVQTEDYLGALRTARMMIEKAPTKFRGFYYFGVAATGNNERDDAIQAFRQSIDLAPQHRPSYDGLLNIFKSKGNKYEARILLHDMVSRFGKKPELVSDLCRLYSEEGLLQDGLTFCKLAVKLNPRFPENHVYLAQNLLYSDQKANASRIFQTAARQFPDSEFVQYATGEYFLSEQNYPTAIRYLELSTKLAPQSFRGFISLAKAQYESDNHDGALISFGVACKLDKSKETTTELRKNAIALRKRGKEKPAGEYERRASVCQQMN